MSKGVVTKVHGDSTPWTSARAVTTDVLESAAAEILQTVEAVRLSQGNPFATDCLQWWSTRTLTNRELDGETDLSSLNLLDAASVNASVASLSVSNVTPELFARYVTTAAGVAMAELTQATVADLLHAYALGRIVSAGVQDVLSSSEVKSGWCDGAATARIAATVCAADLLHLDGKQLQSAIGLAATQASGLTVRSGSGLVGWRLGCATRDALLAALLGATPWAGPAHPLDGTRGLYQLYGATLHPDEMCGDATDPDRIAALAEAADRGLAFEAAQFPFVPSTTVAELTPHFVRVSTASDLSNAVHTDVRGRNVSSVL
jgi:hypothetical protein